MDILLTPQLVSTYINNYSKINKTEEDKLINLIFENKNNNYILNKKLIEKYELEFKPQSNELDRFQTELVMILDSRTINKASTKDVLIEILQETHDVYIREKTSHETYLNLSIDEANSLKNDYSGILDKISNVNSKDYTFYFLAAYNPICLTKWHYDFNDDNQIKTFLENIYKLRTLNEINIFDKNINLTHNYYNFFKNKRIKFNYYTLKHRNFSIVDRIDQYRTIKKFFDSCALNVFRAPNKIIHERRLMFNNIIITFDNDPANVCVNEPNWKIDIYVCNNIKSQMDNKRKNMFDRDNSN
jgi:hypothetical protein